MALIEIIKMSKVFGGIKALTDVDLKVEENQVYGLIGPNGAGKSTLFNCATGIYQQTNGKIIFKGEDVSKLKTHKRVKKGISRTFQETTIFPQLSVLDNVRLGFHLYSNMSFMRVLFNLNKLRQREEEIERESLKILTFMNLIEFKDDKAVNLSHGHQQYIEIAIALATKPKLLLLDEPFAGISRKEKEMLGNLLLQIREKGTTILIVEHDMETVMRLCDRITVLNYGQKIAEGTPQEIQNNQEVITAYLGAEDEQYVSYS